MDTGNKKLTNHFVILEKDKTKKIERTIYSFDYYQYVKKNKFIYIYSKFKREDKIKFISFEYDVILLEYKNENVRIFND